MPSSVLRKELFNFTILTFIALQKANYLIDSQKFRGQPFEKRQNLYFWPRKGQTWQPCCGATGREQALSISGSSHTLAGCQLRERLNPLVPKVKKYKNSPI